MKVLERAQIGQNGRGAVLVGVRPPSGDVEYVGHHDGVLFEVWTISPELAELLLERVHNRPVKQSRVDRYASIQKRGAWELNYEWIGIDEEEAVCEGQHRLRACVKSGVPIRSLVLSSYPRRLFPSIGVSSPRGVSDNLALVGIPSSNVTAAALAYLHRAENGIALYTTGLGSRPESDEAIALQRRHPGIVDSVRSAARCARIHPHIGMLAYLHYEFQRRDAQLAERFVARLADGVDLKQHDPVYLLRERLLDNKRDKRQMKAKYVLAITIKAWNYLRAGRRAPKFLRWSEEANEAFPEIQ